MVRARSDVKMPNFKGNDPNFMNRYMRERMIELAFEDHRFWDVRRWKKGNEFFAVVKPLTWQNRLTESSLPEGNDPEAGMTNIIFPDTIY